MSRLLFDSQGIYVRTVSEEDQQIAVEEVNTKNEEIGSKCSSDTVSVCAG